MKTKAEKINDIAIVTGKVADGEVAVGRSRRSSGFTGTELPREPSSEYKTFPNLTMGRIHRSVRLDELIAAPNHFITECI